MSASQEFSKGASFDVAPEDPSPPAPTDAANDAAPESTFFTASHAALFGEPGSEVCDICAAAVEDDAEEGFAPPGRGLYAWSRGGETRYEEPPLCPSCAAVVSVSALARWEIEEEEG